MAELRSVFSTLWKLTLLLTLLQLAGPAVAFAQTAPDLLQTKGFVADHNWFSPFDWEHFDATSANVMLTFTDLTLPGNAGRQLRFTRIFNSNFGHFDTSRWTFGLAGMVMKIVEKNEDPPNDFDFNDDDIHTITSYTPLFIMADGALHPTAYESDPSRQPPAQLRQTKVISGQFVKYDRVSRTLYVPDGTVCHYNAPAPNGPFYNDDTRHPILTLQDCSDPFGNTVTLARSTQGGQPILTVSQALGNGQSRDVVFQLNPDGNPSSMTFAGRTWQYVYVDSAAGRDLQTVTLPTGETWTFAYDGLFFGYISDITLPTGGRVDPGHVNGDPTDPQSWNMYAYARNNPLRFLDPTGTCSQDASANYFDSDNEGPTFVSAGPCQKTEKGGLQTGVTTTVTVKPEEVSTQPPLLLSLFSPVQQAEISGFAQGVKQTVGSLFSLSDTPSCLKLFVGDTFSNLLPISPSFASLAEPGANAAAATAWNRALSYAAARPNYLGGQGLLYPFKSGVFRSMVGRSSAIVSKYGPAAAEAVAMAQALASEKAAWESGQCR